MKHTKGDLQQMQSLPLAAKIQCKCNQLFTSNRQEGCATVQEFYDKRFYRKSSPFSPQFQYGQEEKQVNIFDYLEAAGNA